MKERNKTHPRQNRYRLARYVKSVPDKAVEIDTQRQNNKITLALYFDKPSCQVYLGVV